MVSVKGWQQRTEERFLPEEGLKAEKGLLSAMNLQDILDQLCSVTIL